MKGINSPYIPALTFWCGMKYDLLRHNKIEVITFSSLQIYKPLICFTFQIIELNLTSFATVGCKFLMTNSVKL